MALPDHVFLEGFDKYAVAGTNWREADPSIFNGVWASLGTYVGEQGFVAPLGVGATGAAFRIGMPNSGINGLLRNMGGWQVPRVIGGCYLKPTLAGISSIYFGDGISVYNVSININTTGTISVRRGGQTDTLIATSVESITSSGASLEWDITFHASAGIVKVWINGVLTSINLTGQNTVFSGGNAFFDRIGLINNTGGIACYCSWDHLYLWGYDTAGGSETPALTSPQIETQLPVSDYDIDSTFVAATLGESVYSFPSSDVSTSGANTISLRRLAVPTSCTLTTVCWVPASGNGGLASTPVVYADSAGAPGVLVGTGPEVVGAVTDVPIELPLTSPVALSPGFIWIGFMNNSTAVNVHRVNENSEGWRKSYTYTLGVPDPAPSGFTGSTYSFCIYGLLSSSTDTWNIVGYKPVNGSFNSVFMETVSDHDLFSFPALNVNADQIYSIQVNAVATLEVPGPRKVELEVLSNVTSSAGDSPTQGLAISYETINSNFTVDPDTGVAWSVSGVNAAKSGFKVVV